ncbi:MAG: alpha/beta hydrolase-fold protein [Caulobacteraceae bacterium]|nr:alpha/beta hydrolase-fold protein [Caulobacteraceae bacterium]
MACAFAAIAGLCGAAPSAPAAPSPVAMAAPATVPGTERFDLTGSNGQTYRISVGLPQGYERMADARFATVYVLDANGSFAMATELARILAAGGEIPPVVVVGIGYPVDFLSETVLQRLRDFTPTPDPVHERLVEALTGTGTPVVSGQAAAFRRFIADQLIPAVEARYRASPHQRLLAGHSLGALFGLAVLADQPDLFDAYVLSSPPVLWDREYVLRRMAQALYPKPRADCGPVRLFLAMGREETTLSKVIGLPPDLTPAERDFLKAVGDPSPVAQFDSLLGVLQRQPKADLTLRSEIFPGETHGSVEPRAWVEGLRWALGPGLEDRCAGKSGSGSHDAR